MTMKLTKTITGIAGGFSFSLCNVPDRPDEFQMAIASVTDEERFLNLGGKKQELEEFLEACAQMLEKLRTFKPETP